MVNYYTQPLDQFATPILGVLGDYSLNGILLVTAYMVVVASIVLLITKVATFSRINNMLLEIYQGQLDFRAQAIFLIFVVYILYIYLGNLLGLIPDGWTITAQLVHNLVMSFTIILGLVMLGLSKYKANFIKLFIPSNVPIVIYPFITALEILSFLIRIVSLALRLFANMVAGHTLLHVLHTFVALGVIGVAMSFIVVKGGVAIIVPSYILLTVITIFELLVAAIQAYVFGLLILVYFKDLYPTHVGDEGAH